LLPVVFRFVARHVRPSCGLENVQSGDAVESWTNEFASQEDVHFPDWKNGRGVREFFRNEAHGPIRAISARLKNVQRTRLLQKHFVKPRAKAR
jgi:hypothetical protein